MPFLLYIGGGLFRSLLRATEVACYLTCYATIGYYGSTNLVVALFIT